MICTTVSKPSTPVNVTCTGTVAVRPVSSLSFEYFPLNGSWASFVVRVPLMTLPPSSTDPISGGVNGAKVRNVKSPVLPPQGEVLTRTI